MLKVKHRHPYFKKQNINLARRKFDSCIPQHSLLNTGVSRNKVRPSHRKSFRDKSIKEEARRLKCSEDRKEAASPKMVCVQARSTNTARESSQPQKQVLVEVEDKRNNSLDLSKVAEVCARQSFLTIATKPSQQNEYEDIRVFQKRKKKKINKPEEDTKQKDANLEKIDFGLQRSVIDLKEKNPEVPIRINQCEATWSPATEARKGDSCTLQKLSGEMVEKTRRKDKRPFESFQNLLFSVFTSCVPWSCMRKVYWRRDQSEDTFTKTSRRNSQARRRARM